MHIGEMIDKVKDIIASCLAVFSWVPAFVEDIDVLLAVIVTILSIVFLIYGIRNRRVEYKIKQQKLEEYEN